MSSENVNFPIKLGLVAFLIFASYTSVQADTIVYRDGTEVDGMVVGQLNERIFFRRSGQEILIKRSRIKKIIYTLDIQPTTVPPEEENRTSNFIWAVVSSIVASLLIMGMGYLIRINRNPIKLSPTHFKERPSEWSSTHYFTVKNRGLVDLYDINLKIQTPNKSLDLNDFHAQIESESSPQFKQQAGGILLDVSSIVFGVTTVDGEPGNIVRIKRLLSGQTKTGTLEIRNEKLKHETEFFLSIESFEKKGSPILKLLKRKSGN